MFNAIHCSNQSNGNACGGHMRSGVDRLPPIFGGWPGGQPGHPNPVARRPEVIPQRFILNYMLHYTSASVDLVAVYFLNHPSLYP